ncbi:MAG: SDR family NAD(P)-dependent oxidoreductase [Pseudomonadota bacterium]
MSNLQNKIICITGASSGIGESCAILCAEHGAKLLLVGRREARLKEVAEKCRQKNAATEIHIMVLDVQKQQAVQHSFENLPDSWQAIDVLVNNAGLSKGLDALDVADIADWEQMIDTNVKGLLYLTRQILPGMKQRGQGQIINIGSISGHITYIGGSVYCATKFAVRAITRALRQELLAYSNIRINLVSPGMVNTEFSNVRFKGDQARVDETYRGFKPLVAEDIANSVLFCMQQPVHVNIEEIIVMPTAQTQAGAMVHRQE